MPAAFLSATAIATGLVSTNVFRRETMEWLNGKNVNGFTHSQTKWDGRAGGDQI
jgi:hypothetical protein